MVVKSHVFPDHHIFQASDFQLADAEFILMTEKDAVKCESFADERMFFVSMQMEMSEAFKKAILARVKYLSKTPT